jgi:deoxyadenosine/deoxycytidine kinase
VFCRNLNVAFENADYPCVVLEEYVNMDLLTWFLEDKTKRAFEFQLVMLHQRILRYRRALKLKKRGYTVIVDRSMQGDIAFELMHYAKGSISGAQHEIYLNQIKENYESLCTPDYCIFLNVSIDSAIDNIKARGRPGESDSYTDLYLNQLASAYAYCLKTFGSPTLKVEYDKDPRRKMAFPYLPEEWSSVSSETRHDVFFDVEFMFVILNDLSIDVKFH